MLLRGAIKHRAYAESQDEETNQPRGPATKLSLSLYQRARNPYPCHVTPI